MPANAYPKLVDLLKTISTGGYVIARESLPVKQIKAVLTELGELSARMKTIALIDIRSEIPGKTLGILVSSHDAVTEAFGANDAFQKGVARRTILKNDQQNEPTS